MMGLPMSGLRKHRPAALLAAAAAVLAVAACGGGSGSSSGGSAIKQGGVFRLGTSSTIDSLNPFIAIQSDAYTTFEYIYPTLVQYTPALKIVANFARSWTTSPDGRTWTFTHPAEREVVRRQAADRGGCGLDLQHHPEVRERRHGQLRGICRAHEERDGAERDHPRAQLLPAGGQRAVAGSAGADHARAHLGPVRHRQRQGAEDLPEQRAGRLRRPVHPDEVHAQAGRAVQEEPRLLRPEAAHRRLRAAVLPDHRRRGDRAQERPAGRDRGARPADLGGGAQGRPFPRPVQSRGFLRRLHHQLQPAAASQPQRAAQPAAAAGVRPRDRPAGRWWRPRCSGTGNRVPRSSRRPPANGRTRRSSRCRSAWPPRTSCWTRPGYKMGPNGLRIANGHPMSYTVIMPSDLAGQYRTRSFQIIQPDFKKIGVQLHAEGPRPLRRLRRDLGQQLPRTSRSPCGTGSR